jgi:ribosomal protein S24E
MLTMIDSCSDILHPNRANISKDELREKLGGLYKAQKDQISVFGLRTHFGGGKTTGFALVYDSPEAMKKFEPQYRLVRVGMATKAERASRQQRMLRYPTTTQDPPRLHVMNKILTSLEQQGSSARTGRRPSVALPRSMVPRR